MGVDEANTSEVFTDEEPYLITIDKVVPFQVRESAKAVQARIDRMAQLGHLIPRVIIEATTEHPAS